MVICSLICGLKNGWGGRDRWMDKAGEGEERDKERDEERD